MDLTDPTRAMTPTLDGPVRVGLPPGSQGPFACLRGARWATARVGGGTTWLRLWAGRRREDRVGSDAPPDDVGLAGNSFVTVAECRAPVVVPGHLEHAGVGGNAFDAQPRAEWAVRSGQVGHEGLGHDLAEGRLLLCGEFLP